MPWVEDGVMGKNHECHFAAVSLGTVSGFMTLAGIAMTRSHFISTPK